MDSHATEKGRPRMWIISAARYAQFALDRLGLPKTPQTAREYRISAIGHYLISPAPLNVPRWLAGCEVHWRPSAWSRWKQGVLKRLGKESPLDKPPRSLLTDFSRPGLSPADARLNRHIQSLHAKLHPFDSLWPALGDIDIRRVADVVGICEDDAGNRTQLRIEGDPFQKLEYVKTFAGQQINVRLKRAYFADGLFEMKGFDFRHYDPDTSFHLIQFAHDGLSRACVVNADRTVAFWLDDPKLVNYLQLFEFSIQQNPHMRQSLFDCMQGKAVPMRLMFNHALKIDYSRAPLPSIFREVIGDCPLADHASQLIKSNLNLHQVGVSLNSMALQGSGQGGLCTDISIFQNLRALEPIRTQLPKLFAEMTKRANHFGAGKFYLLDAMRGVHNER